MRIVGYCRVSTEKEEQINSLQNQKFFFSEYASKNGHTLVGIYADEGISGTSLKKRKEFNRLMNDASLDIFDMVVVKDISRFSRNTVDFLQSIRALKALGITTLFLSSNMDSFGESEFILAIFSALAQEESINLSKRIKFGKNISAQKGSVPQLIFGYDRIDQYTLKINEQEGAVVKEIFKLYVEDGLGCRTICEKLNNNGHKTKLGYEWNSRGVSRILNNSIYCGDYVNHKFEVENCLEGKVIARPPSEHIHHYRKEWEIISKEMFDIAQYMIKQRSKNNNSRTKHSSKYIFSSLVICEECGRSFVRKKYNRANDERVYWKCPTYDQFGKKKCENNVTVDENVLLSKIRSFYIGQIQSSDAFKNEILDDILNSISSHQESKNSEKKYRLLNIKKNKYLELFSEGIIDHKYLTDKINALEIELSQLASQNKDTLDNHKENRKSYLQKIDSVINFNNISNSDIRKLIDIITVCKNGRIKIYFKDYEKGDFLFDSKSRSG